MNDKNNNKNNHRNNRNIKENNNNYNYKKNNSISRLNFIPCIIFIILIYSQFTITLVSAQTFDITSTAISSTDITSTNITTIATATDTPTSTSTTPTNTTQYDGPERTGESVPTDISNNTDITSNIPISSRGNEYPLDAASYLTGITLISTGLIILFRGNKYKWLSIFFAAFYGTYVISPSSNVRFVYFIICVGSGTAAGTFFVFLWPTGKILVGGLGGFSLSMICLSIKNDGLITNQVGRWIFMGIFTLIMGLLASIKRSYQYLAIISTASTGCYALILGIDVFVKAGLLASFKTFWGFIQPSGYEFIVDYKIAIILSSVIAIACPFGIGFQLLELKFYDNSQPITALDFDGTGEYCVTASADETINLYNCRTGKVVALEMSPINDQFLTGSINEGRPCVGYDPSGLVFAIALQHSDKTIQLHDVRLKFSNDGQKILINTSGDVHYIMDAFDGNLKQRLIGHMGLDNASSFLGGEETCFTPDEPMTMKPFHILNHHTLPTQAIKFNPNKLLLVSACTDLVRFQ
ncbi:4942_t:CDS:2 [Diversispora eburnea]|uniref:4942_t:CDS:1 n=1 Tax=Diversispora eburnea TaxID=1213867 RepID=A0A9N8W7G9_9GLOM|nr:4942_t:CDS:2 [Diversispora eburnea]